MIIWVPLTVATCENYTAYLCLQVRAVIIFTMNTLFSSALLFGTVFFNVLSLARSQQNLLCSL